MKPEKYMQSFSIIHRYSVMSHLRDMKKSRVSGHQMGYIIHIKKNPGASQEDLVEFFKLNKGTVAKGVKKLLEEEYIIRKQNENDRRAYRLYLTDKGERFFAESENTIKDFRDILTSGMTEAEQIQFYDLLQRATANVIEAAGDDKDDLLRPGPPSEHGSCCKEEI